MIVEPLPDGAVKVAIVQAFTVTVNVIDVVCWAAVEVIVITFVSVTEYVPPSNLSDVTTLICSLFDPSWVIGAPAGIVQVNDSDVANPQAGVYG